MRIVVTAGYSKSLHAVALIHQLSAHGHEVALCLEVRVLDVKRLRFYLRQIGPRKLWQKFLSRFFPNTLRVEGASKEVEPVLEYLHKHNISSQTVSQACKQVGSEHIMVSELNSPKALSALCRLQPDLVVYAGGGILRRQFIESPKLGVLNAHGGPLPCFRGMNAAEWALLHGVRPGITAHYIDTGIDTGPIFFQRTLQDDAWLDKSQMRGWGAQLNVKCLLEAVEGISENRMKATAQNIEDGRQYFVMAEPLLEVLQRWVEQGLTPKMDSEAFNFLDQV